MPTPDVITLDELPEYYAGVAEDWQQMDWSQYLRDELALIAFLHAEYFTTESGPDGKRWPPLSPSTRKKVGIEGPNRILVDTGALKASLTGGADNQEDSIRVVDQKADGWFLLFGTWVPYSGLHDEEGFNPFRPARRHVGLTDEYLDEACERAASYAVKELVDVR